MAASKSKTYAAKEQLHLYCSTGQSKPADFAYLPEELRGDKILSCSLHTNGLSHFTRDMKPSDPLVTNPITRRWHSVSFPCPPGGQPGIRLHATVHDTPHSFMVLVVVASGYVDDMLEGFWVSLYNPATGWRTEYINLEGGHLALRHKYSPVQPLVFDGAALYFLTLPSSSLNVPSEHCISQFCTHRVICPTGSSHSKYHGGCRDYTLNCVHVLGSVSDQSFRLEKLHSCSSLPRGMWPADNRVHPKLVACSGEILLAGTSFLEGGRQGPVVLLAFERETKAWKVGDEVSLPGYVAKRCGVSFRDCVCRQDLLISGWDDELLVTFQDEREGYSYDLNTRCRSKLHYPRKTSMPIHISSRARIP